MQHARAHAPSTIAHQLASCRVAQGGLPEPQRPEAERPIPRRTCRLKSVAVFIIDLFLRGGGQQKNAELRRNACRKSPTRARLQARPPLRVAGDGRRSAPACPARFRCQALPRIAAVPAPAGEGGQLQGRGSAAAPARRAPPALAPVPWRFACLRQRAARPNASWQPHLALLVRSACVPGILSRTFSFQRRQPAPMVALEWVRVPSTGPAGERPPVRCLLLLRAADGNGGLMAGACERGEQARRGRCRWRQRSRQARRRRHRRRSVTSAPGHLQLMVDGHAEENCTKRPEVPCTMQPGGGWR